MDENLEMMRRDMFALADLGDGIYTSFGQRMIRRYFQANNSLVARATLGFLAVLYSSREEL